MLAIAVRGKGKISIANEGSFSLVCRLSSEKILGNPDNLGMRIDGTIGGLGKCDMAGDWPTMNWRSNSWGKGQDIYEYFKKNNLVGSKGVNGQGKCHGLGTKNGQEKCHPP